MHLCVCGVLRCLRVYVWSSVLSLVTFPTIPFLGAEMQAQQAKYFDQGCHTLSRRGRKMELGIRLSQSGYTSWVTGDTMKNRLNENN